MSEHGGGPGARRSLTNVGGPTELAGDEADAALLGRALAAAEDPDAGRAHVHGFHSYPARLHPAIARALVEALSPLGGAVLDPFCGSGTVLVEARLAGRRALGVDANPLGARLSELKAAGRPAERGEALLARAAEVAAVASARRRARAGASRPYPPDEFAAFAPHVLLELDGLRVGLESLGDADERGDLELVLSSLLTKLGRRAGDSSDAPVEKRLAAGYPTRLFVKKTEELVERLAAYRAALPPGAPPPSVREGDARWVGPENLPPITLALTSPPYPGTYDYLHHHALRLRWLGLDAEGFDRREIGARRRLNELPYDEAVAAWEGDLGAVLAPLGRALAPGGSVVLVMADSALAGRAFDSARSVRRVAERAALRLTARASQRRPHFHAPTSRAFGVGPPRREHALLLRPAALAAGGPSALRRARHAHHRVRRQRARARPAGRRARRRRARRHLRRPRSARPLFMPRRQLLDLPGRGARGRGALRGARRGRARAARGALRRPQRAARVQRARAGGRGLGPPARGRRGFPLGAPGRPGRPSAPPPRPVRYSSVCHCRYLLFSPHPLVRTPIRTRSLIRFALRLEGRRRVKPGK